MRKVRRHTTKVRKKVASVVVLVVLFVCGLILILDSNSNVKYDFSGCSFSVVIHAFSLAL